MKLLITLITTLMLSACSTAKITLNEKPIKQTTPIEIDQYQNNFLFGLIHGDEIEPAQICPENTIPHSVVVEYSYIHLLFTFITSGLYTPNSVVISCYEK